jgi:signal transduction histidine kinase
VAHDLRTPLGAISLSLAALERAMPQRNADLTAIVPRMLSSLRRNVARLSRRVEAVLDSNGDGEPHPQPILLRLRPLVADLARALGDRARASSTQLENDVPAELEVTADPALLGRALENLLVNAIESTPQGRVIIGAAHDGDRVRCWVQDNGEGIAPERLDSIFDVGQSTATPVGYRGLGLAIVRQLVAVHHGQVSVSSDESGSTFRIDLPATARADGAVNQGPAVAP